MHTNTVAVIGLSDLDWIISVFGLVRVGFVVLLLSRLSAQAIIKLMEETHCESLVMGKHPVLGQMAQAIHAHKPVPLLSMLGRKDYDTIANRRRRDHHAFFGLYRLPKADIHKTLPLYDGFGAWARDKRNDDFASVSWSSACVALTDVAQLPRLFLHRLSSTPISSKDNIFPKPKYALDMTETAMLGTSMNRPEEDNAWAYIRPSPSLLEHIWPKPLGDGTFEFVYLRENPSLVVSNSDQPPGSYHSKDIFSPHPRIPNARKHVGRIDDRITLLNGEKFLPLAVEGRIQEHVLVKAAVVFGNMRPLPGILVLCAEAAKNMDNDEVIIAIYPAVQAANHDT
ncbi:MAG: hypothetical protein Q9188_003522 [Gyalolechia gomerana]